jgi:bacteriocin-like protein
MSKEKLNENDLENVSGGARIAMPDSMSGMKRREVKDLLGNDEFQGSDDFQSMLDMNGVESADQLLDMMGGGKGRRRG